MEVMKPISERSTAVRRWIAIALTLLSILSLFWPAAAALNREAASGSEFAAMIGKTDEEGLASVKEFLYKDSGGYREVEAFPELTEKAERSFLDFYHAVGDGALSFFDVRTVAAALLGTMADIVRVAQPKSGSFAGISPAIPTAANVAVNVLFYGMIVFGVLAVLMMLFNKSRVFGVLLTVIAFLFAGVVLMLLIAIPDDHGVKAFTPGASLFLLPICSLLACIVYKRVKPPKRDG